MPAAATPGEVPIGGTLREARLSGLTVPPATQPPAPFPGGNATHMPEMFGDVMVVNGKAWPNVDVEPREYRVRLLNGGSIPSYGTANEGLTVATNVPLYVKGHSQGEYIFDHGWAEALERAGGRYYPKLQVAVPFPPATGRRFLGPPEHRAALLDAAGVERAALVGHSWGSLIALEAAARLGQRISHLVLVGTASPMRVSAALLEASQTQPMQALQLVNVFSRSTLSPPPSALGPGTWVYGAAMALGRRVLASNAQVNVFHRGFVACDRYANGEAAMAAIRCPVLFVIGTQDQMTPPKAARPLIEAARACGQRVEQVLLPVGHNQMTEAPEQTLQAITRFLAS